MTRPTLGAYNQGYARFPPDTSSLIDFGNQTPAEGVATFVIASQFSEPGTEKPTGVDFIGFYQELLDGGLVSETFPDSVPNPILHVVGGDENLHTHAWWFDWYAANEGIYLVYGDSGELGLELDVMWQMFQVHDFDAVTHASYVDDEGASAVTPSLTPDPDELVVHAAFVGGTDVEPQTWGHDGAGFVPVIGFAQNHVAAALWARSDRDTETLDLASTYYGGQAASPHHGVLLSFAGTTPLPAPLPPVVEQEVIKHGHAFTLDATNTEWPSGIVPAPIAGQWIQLEPTEPVIELHNATADGLIAYGQTPTGYPDEIAYEFAFIPMGQPVPVQGVETPPEEPIPPAEIPYEPGEEV